MELKRHPSNPHGVLVPCATCDRELHLPRADITEGGVDPADVTCSYDCMKAHKEQAS